ncbi:TonB family protein [Dechloromonas sp. ARDL1]|uniref:energy transducer TonB n=1 Tax=Dechloromonas sp. ARDL1 TaxID=3322121 RepID=UPI003DA724D9
MSYALSRPTTARRSGLLGIVIGTHIGIILIVMASKTVVPQIMEMPLIVDLIQPAQEKPPEAKPLPVVKPQPVRQQPTPQKHVPVVEATQSTLPAPAAPVATPPEVKPAPPAPPAPEPVVQARFDADYLKNPAPPYPPLSRRMGEEGKVILRVSVTPAGTAESVEIKTSSGSQRLDESAQKTVRTWKFIPAKRGSEAVQSFVLVPIIFKLEQ